jgi:hypothetical protein
LSNSLEKFAMKKTLIALAALAVAGTAFAQSSVTLGGTFNVDADAKPAIGSAASTNTVGMGDAILSATVKEDLGGGMNITANTTLQTKAGRGGNVTNNGYSLAFGTANAGTVTLSNYLNGAAGLSAGISAAQDMNHIVGAYSYRNRLNYALPTIVKGLTVQVRYDTTNPTAPSPANVDLKDQTTKYAVQYTSGPVSAGFSGSKTDSFGDMNASYDFGVAKAAVYRTHPLTGTANTEMTIVAPFGATTVGLHSITGGKKGYGLVASYALSKRTAISANFVKQTTGADSTWDGKNNTRVRLSHTF